MFTVAGVAVLALGVAYLVGVFPQGRKVPENGFDYGPKAVLVQKLREELAEQPCDRTKAVQYLQTLFSAEDLHGSIRFADDFTARCGKFAQLRSITYSAHTRLNEFDLAVQDATELIESAPGNAGHWIWRGMAHEAREKSELALADFEQAFRLKPEEFQVANQLASAYERQHRTCDTHLVLLEHTQANPAEAGRVQLTSWLEGLARGSKCIFGKGSAVVPVARAGVRWVEPLVEGKARGRFILDTRASTVTLSQGFAERLGLKLEGTPTVPLHTADGTVQAHVTRVQSIELQGARAENVEVVVTSSLPEGAEGVLGLGFLARFEMKLDARAGRLELSERTWLEREAR
ncbi:hypothetical protein DAT35_42240 [Vitiosangium sp. GDMCC 1.1324]|nr:hypothetical protein DAT35_42240 [Vitiosangium sp. GDMCC 1.1324]